MRFLSKYRRVDCCRKRRAALSLETLECRVALHGESPLSASDRFVTLSFAPDGVQIGDEANSLRAKFDAVLPQQNWRETILRAFQTWAAQTSVDVGLVDEQGTWAFGTPGPRSGDSRFGDIRVGGRSLAANTMAISVSQDDVVSGTWAADVVLNVDAEFASMDELFSVVLHEAGHVFGLPHSDDPSSPMHIHGVSAVTQLTAADIEQVRASFGTRLPDAWEGNDGNETMATAREIEPIKVVEEQPGSGPAIVVGNLHTVDDVDFYSLEVLNHYTGPLTFRLDTAGTSLLSANLTVMTPDGEQIASISQNGMSGKSLMYTIPQVTEDEEYLIRVQSAVDDVFAVGGYTLMALFDDALRVSDQQLEQIGSSRLRLSPDEVESLLSTDHDFLNPDDGRDDSEDDAAASLPASEFMAAPRYVLTGSIETSADQDVYKIKSPRPEANLPVLHAAVRSLTPGQLVPRLVVLDEKRQVMPATILVNGGGELLVQVESLAADRDYFVRVAAADSQQFAVGDYQLTVSFVAEPAALQTFAQGRVGGAAQQSVHQLHVATPQLFHFALTADAANTTGQAGVLLRVLDESGTVIHQLSSRTAETRTGGGLLLLPGSYLLQVVPLFEHDADRAASLDFRLTGSVVSDPFAVDPVQPSDTEFQCPDLPGLFCYPGGIISIDPYLWLDFLDQLPAVPDLTGPELQSALLGDWWSWYWSQQTSNIPPLAIADAYQVDPEALLQVDAAHGLLANDIDPDSSEITVRVVQGATYGSLSVNSDGSFSYQPETGFVGADHFTYEAYDFRHVSSPVTVTIDVGGGGLPGDSNRDGVFDSTDLVQVFQAGQYEDGVLGNSTWSSGDWNGDGEFDSQDLVFAFQAGSYQE